MKILRKIFYYYDKILHGVLIALVSSFTVICLLQVIMRYVFNNSLTWSEEVCRILFVYTAFFGTAILIAERKHISIDILTNLMSNGQKRILYLFIHALIFVFCIFLTYSGMIMASKNGNQITSALRLNMGTIYMMIPTAGVLMCINAIRAGYTDWCYTYAPKKENGGDIQ